MALTDFSPLFASVHEDGINRLVRHVMAQRPSLFNYGTQWVADAPDKRLCKKPLVDPVVRRRKNPIITVEPPLPIVGTGGMYGMNFAAQLTELEIDFSPGTIGLPGELNPPLKDQHFALRAEMCAGLGCPDDKLLDQFPPAPQPPFHVPGDDRPNKDDDRKEDDQADKGRTIVLPTIVLPTLRLQCFCLEFFVVGHAEVNGSPDHEVLEMKVDGLEIVDIKPQGLENGLECYLRMLLRYVVLPRMALALPVFVFDLLNLATITIEASTSVNPNPAIEDDLLKLFVDFQVGP
jgi:hypothetical protein